jgi:hypothetical protein
MIRAARTRPVRPLGALLLAGVTVTVLAGCGATDVADRGYGGLPPEVSLSPDTILGEDGPSAVLRDGGSTLALTTWGSSSCHAIAESADWTDAGLSVQLGSAGGDACTADLGPYTLEFDVPSDRRGEPFSVELTYADREGTTTLEVG